jgi:SAM-dependent methyltransferase/transcriptional regulator with XRE-family HTH domain
MNSKHLVAAIQSHTNWSQEELAHKLGVSFATLNSWANGRSTPRRQAHARLVSLHQEVLNQSTQTAPAAKPGNLHVFFTTPYAGKDRYQPYIDAIVSAIRQSNQAVTPEDTAAYLESLAEYQGQGLDYNQAHYAYIRQGIAAADAVIIEATQEDIRVGHEITLALLFHKPTLVLAQGKNFADYITHDLLTGVSYTTADEAAQATRDFLQSAVLGRAEASMQTLNLSADNLHSVALAKLRRLAKQEPGQFGEWARAAEQRPQKVAQEIQTMLGGLKQQPAWSVFAPVYNEDSPDYIQSGVATFIDGILRRSGVRADDSIVEAACGTGALSRQLASRGYHQITAFDNSRPMLAEAFRLSANTPEITLVESDIQKLDLREPAKAIIWTDYSSNFALDAAQLSQMLLQLLQNLQPGGLLIFDVRTYTGWQIDFYAQPITTFATERFQRIWLNHQHKKEGVIDFDVFIRVRDADGAWAPWQRESMRERMWRLNEVQQVVDTLPNASTQAVYGDDFREIGNTDDEPGLAYFVLQKTT